MKPLARRLVVIQLLLTALPCLALAQIGTTYRIVDTGQVRFYDNTTEIEMPSPGEPFYGQDAHYAGNTPAYTDNADGTATDLLTGLMWQKSPDRDGDGVIDYADKLFFDEAVDSAASCTTGGYGDWRLPTIKELYSLIMFFGVEPSPSAQDTVGCIPFVDTNYFDFAYGDLGAGERIIDAQYASSTVYVSTTMGGNRTMFGVNFADGRIKGYPADEVIGQKYYVRYVRENSAYGMNTYIDNGDGTITDNATGLMWMKDDSGVGVLWENALSYVEGLEYADHTDWRLPNAKELHSIVDYAQSPATSNSAAIDSLFNCTPIINEAGEADYTYYWTSTTHCSQSPANGPWAAYFSFGRAMGYMAQLGGWIDVHGAGAQRSDPKTGDPDDFPYGHGPQGDAVRIYNLVRVVRDAGITGVDNGQSELGPQPVNVVLTRNHPNPFNPRTTISFELLNDAWVSLRVYDVLGGEVATLVDDQLLAGRHEVSLDGSQLGGGIYFYRLQAGAHAETHKAVLLK